MESAAATADKLIDAVIGREGVFVDDPRDLGGATRWGVTERVARAHGYRGAMKTLPRETAVAIYRDLYWTAPRFDGVARRYPTVAAELFDIGVNMGTGVAGQFLQRVLNVMNQGATIYADLTVDGRLGMMSFAALDSFRQRRGDEGEARLLVAITSLRGARYIEISEQRPANEAFTYGWFGRMVEIMKGWRLW